MKKEGISCGVIEVALKQCHKFFQQITEKPGDEVKLERC